MPGTTLQEILGARNLTGLIQSVMGGVPEDLIPASFMTPKRQVNGNQAIYQKVQSTRQVARLVQYGGTPRKRQLQGVTDTPVVLAHFYESFSVDPTTMMALLDEGNEQRQRMGAQTLARQVGEFGRLFRNNRAAAFFSLIARGKISYDSNGEFQITDQASTGGVDIDFGVPAGNQGTLNVDGGGVIIDASWATNTTKIITHIKKIKKAARKQHGFPIVHAFYGENIPNYLLLNDQLKEMINRNTTMQEAFAVRAAGEIPNGFLGLNWHPVDQAFWETSGGTNTDFFGADQITFTPEASPEWFEWFEGSYPVPTNTGTVFASATDALANLREVFGAFSYAVQTLAPVGIEGYAGDTVAPIMKVPKAMYIADVTP